MPKLPVNSKRDSLPKVSVSLRRAEPLRPPECCERAMVSERKTKRKAFACPSCGSVWTRKGRDGEGIFLWEQSSGGPNAIRDASANLHQDAVVFECVLRDAPVSWGDEGPEIVIPIALPFSEYLLEQNRQVRDELKREVAVAKRELGVGAGAPRKSNITEAAEMWNSGERGRKKYSHLLEPNQTYADLKKRIGERLQADALHGAVRTQSRLLPQSQARKSKHSSSSRRSKNV